MGRLSKTTKSLEKIKAFLSGIFLLTGSFIPTAGAEAQVPQTINYQSRLRTIAQQPITASTTIQFSLYSHPTNGNPADAPSQSGPLVWRELYNQASGACMRVQPDSQGYFYVQLGSCSAFPAYIDFNSPLYLGVKIETDAEAAPRVLLASHPYALNSQRVNSLEATTTAAGGQLLALEDDLDFNIATGTFYGGGLAINGTSTLQNLTFTVSTGTSLNLNDYLAIGAIRLDATGTSNVTSGAYLVGVFDEFDNSNATTVQAVLADLDTAITAVSSTMFAMDLQQVTDNGATTTNRIQFAGATSTGNMLFDAGSDVDITVNRAPNSSDGFNLNIFGGDAGLFSVGANTGGDIVLNGGLGRGFPNIPGNIILANLRGNVGIGNILPNYKLDVDGIIRLGAELLLGQYASLPFAGSQSGSVVYNTSSSTVHYWDGTQWRTVATAEDVRSSLWDTDHDTGVQVEESADEDVIRFDTAGVQRMYITNDGRIGVGTTDPLSALFTVGPGAHEASSFSVSGDPAYFNIANFRDEDGESIFRANGSVAGNDLLITFGDKEQAGNGTYLGVDYANNSINLSNSELRFQDLNRDNYVALIAPAVLTTNTTYILPYQDGVNNQVLITDGAGNLSWATSTDLVTNIYTADGDLTGDRTVSGDGVGLGINTVNGGYFEVDVEDGADYSFIHAYSDELELNVTNPSAYSGMVFNSGGSSFTHNQSGSSTQFYIGSNMTLTDGINFRGINYAADYSANYTNRTLVDKAYVDNAVLAGTNNIYTNDGTLTGNRTLDADGYGLTFHNNWIDYQINDDSSAIIADDGFSRSRFDIEPFFFQLYSQENATNIGASVVGSNTGILSMVGNTIGGAFNETRLQLESGQFVISTGSTTFSGATYDKDYSANYVNRSLVDKEYVDNTIASSTVNIYNSDGSLNEDRTVNLNGNYLNFENSNLLVEIGEDEWIQQMNQGDFYTELNQDGGTIVYNASNSSSSAWGNLNIRTDFLELSSRSNGVNTSNIHLDSDDILFTSNFPNFEGATYAADYSANYIDRSLVDKAYVDSAITSSTVAAGNGLTLNSGVMNLGGTLTQTTYLDHMGYDLVVREFAGEPETLFAGDNFKIQDGGYEVRFGIGGPTALGISLTNPSSTFDLFTFDSYVGAISDRTDFEGIVYDKDYSSYFQNHSLVDKAYVDALVTGTTSGLTFQDVADNTIAADGYVYYETGAAATEDDGGAFKIEALAGGYEVEMAEAGGTKLNFKSANGLDPAAVVFYDVRPTTTGIEYGADYSADYTNRSLVDKEYVDGLVSSTTLQTAYNGGGSALGRQILTTGSSTAVEIINPGTDQWESSLVLTNSANGGGLAFQTMDSFGDWGGRMYFTDDTSDPANGTGGFLDVNNTAQAFEFGYQTAGTRNSNFYIDYNQMSLNVPGTPNNGAFGITASNYNVPILTLRGPSIGNNIAFHVGTSTPEARVTAISGSLFARTDGTGGGEQLYVKTTDAGNTGWVPLSSAGSVTDLDGDTKIQVEESSDEDYIRFDTAGEERMYITNNGELHFADGGYSNAYFNIDNPANPYTGDPSLAGIYLDSGQDRVALFGTEVYVKQNLGVGVLNPNGLVDIGEGMILNPRGDVSVLLSWDGGDSFFETASTDMAEGLLMLGSAGDASEYGVIRNVASTGYANGWDRGLHIFTSSTGAFNDPIILSTDSVERMRITDDGFVGIATSTPGYTLDVIGDVRASAQFMLGQYALNPVAGEQAGAIIYNTASSTPFYWDGTQWIALGGSGASAGSLWDADHDTGIQVEENSDDDTIRFDVAGTEYFTITARRITPVNSGGSIFIGNWTGQNDDNSANQNVFIGNSAGYSNTSGHDNILMGARSGYNLTTGSDNVFLGYEAGYAPTTQSRQVAIGYHAGRNSTGAFGNTMIGYIAGRDNTGNDNVMVGYESGIENTGSDNFFMGRGTGRYNTGNLNIMMGYYNGFNNTGDQNIFFGNGSGSNNEGDHNIFMGFHAGYNNIGNDNIFMGYQAGRNHATGTANIFLGRESGYSNILGDYNVFLGYQAGYNETGSNRLYIENSNTANPLVYGEFDNDVLRINGALQVGNPSSTGYAFPLADGGTDGLVLATNAAGNLYWASSTLEGVTSTHWQKNSGILSPQDSTVYRVDVANNSASTLTGFKAVNTNDVSNYAGAVLELKGSGADYTNNLYFGKYGANFYVPSWAGNGVLATDKNLVIGAVSSSSVIRFQVGGGYTAPNSVATFDSNSLDLLAGIDLNVGGNTVFGDATSDTVTFNARVDSDILPSSSLVYNLGSSTARWNNAWVATMHIGTSTYELAQSADQAFTITNTGKGEFARIDKTGKFGVGTQQPEELISTTGDLLIGQYDNPIAPLSGQNRQMILRATDAQLPGIQGTAYVTYQRDGADLARVGLDTSNNINFGHYSGTWNTDMVLSTHGNLGIGTTPSRRLDVQGDTTPGDNLFRVAGGANGAYLSVYASTTDDRNTVIEVQRNLDFFSQSNHILSMGHAGNVGVGIFDPLYKLDVSGDVRVLDELLLGQYALNPASGLQAGSIIYNTASSTPFFWNGSDWKAITYLDASTLDAAYDAGGSGLGRQITTDAGAVYLTGAGNGTALQIDYSGSGQGLAMNNSGSGTGVTVGNTSIGTSFYARNQSTGRGFWVDNNAGGQGLYIDNGYGGTGQHIVNDGTGIGLSILQSSTDMGLYIRQHGGVGLQLENNTANDGLFIDTNSTGNGLAVLNNGSGSNGIRVDNDTTGAGLYIEDTAGKAAINISKPEGSGDLIYMSNQGTGDGIDISHTSSGKAIRIANTGTGDSFYITDEGSDSTPFVLNSSGNLGIDQANPLAKLHLGYTDAASSADYAYMFLQGSGDVEHVMYLPTGSNLMVWDFNNTGNGGAIEFRNYGSRVGMFTNSGLVINDGGLAGIGLRVEGDTDTALLYTDAANDRVGIGTNAPATKLFVKKEGDTVAAFDRALDDGIVISIRQDGVEEGSISVSGNAVSYNAFTGSHYAWTDQDIARGTLVSMMGDNKYLHDNPESEILYGISISTEVNDPQIMGSYLALQESNKVHDENNPHLVMAVGNGEVWVADKGENINIGDYLISSDVAGHAQKDTGEFAVSHIVARAAESIDWTHVADAKNGVKHKKISVFFEAFDKNNMHSSIAGTSLQGGDSNLDVVDLVVGNAVFEGTITVKGHVAFAEDTVGQAMIMTGDTRVSVEFTEEYGTLPIVTVTPAGKVTVPYWVENASMQGFDIVLDSVQYQDLLFNWHAFGNVEGRVYVSNGTTLEIEVNDMGASSLETEINSMPMIEETATSTEAVTEETVATTTEDFVNVEILDESDSQSTDTDQVVEEEEEIQTEEPALPADETQVVNEEEPTMDSATTTQE